MMPAHAASGTPRVMRNDWNGLMKLSAKKTTQIVPTVRMTPSMKAAAGAGDPHAEREQGQARGVDAEHRAADQRQDRGQEERQQEPGRQDAWRACRSGRPGCRRSSFSSEPASSRP